MDDNGSLASAVRRSGHPDERLTYEVWFYGRTRESDVEDAPEDVEAWDVWVRVEENPPRDGASFWALPGLGRDFDPADKAGAEEYQKQLSVILGGVETYEY